MCSSTNPATLIKQMFFENLFRPDHLCCWRHKAVLQNKKSYRSLQLPIYLNTSIFTGLIPLILNSAMVFLINSFMALSFLLHNGQFSHTSMPVHNWILPVPPKIRFLNLQSQDSFWMIINNPSLAISVVGLCMRHTGPRIEPSSSQITYHYPHVAGSLSEVKKNDTVFRCLSYSWSIPETDSKILV